MNKQSETPANAPIDYQKRFEDRLAKMKREEAPGVFGACIVYNGLKETCPELAQLWAIQVESGLSAKEAYLSKDYKANKRFNEDFKRTKEGLTKLLEELNKKR